MNIRIFCYVIIGLTAQLMHAKVVIFTYVYNRPDFIEIQHLTFQKFLEDDYEFVVFSDAKEKNMARHIQNMCAKYGIKCIPIPQDIHTYAYLKRWPHEPSGSPTIRNVNGVMYSLRNYGFDHDDILVLLDSDMFLVKKLNIRKALEGYDMLAHEITYTGLPYVWHAVIFLNMKTLPNVRTLDFNCGKIDDVPVDAAGQTYYYLHDNPEVRLKRIDAPCSSDFRCTACKYVSKHTCTHMRNALKKAGFDDHQAAYFEESDFSQFLYNGHFLHYRGASNWQANGKEYIQEKTNAFYKYISGIIQ